MHSAGTYYHFMIVNSDGFSCLRTCHRDRAEPASASCPSILSCPPRRPPSASPHPTAPNCQLHHQPHRRCGGFPRGLNCRGADHPPERTWLFCLCLDSLFPPTQASSSTGSRVHLESNPCSTTTLSKWLALCLSFLSRG